MQNNVFIAAFLNEPGLVASHQAEKFVASLSALNAKVSEEGFVAATKEAAASDSFWPEPGSYLAEFRPYVVSNGVLQIPVQGVLLNGFPYAVAPLATGYEYIQKAFERGLSDENVKGIALVIDSPGGMVAGNFDLVDKMFAQRGQKPVAAFASESAYSAAYSLASVADTITVSRTGGVGSIGVVTMHMDVSAAMEKAGVKVTFIHAGKHKVDGNAYAPLPDAVKERIQARIDGLYDIFVSTVARNRGIDEKAVRATEALTFTASESLSNKLADAIGSLDDGLAAFAADLNTNQGETIMSKEVQDKGTVDQAAIDSARVEGKSEGMKEGVASERARISAILALDESQSRSKAALNIALTTDLTVESAKSLLATLPEDKKEEAQASSFEKAMNESENPNVGSGQALNTGSDPAASILADYRAAGGIGLK